MYRHVKLRALGQLALRAYKTASPMPKRQQTPNDDARGRPFVLWSYTLPNGDRAAVHLRTRRESVDVIRYRNGQACRLERCVDLAEAQQRGWEWRAELVSRLAHPTRMAVTPVPQRTTRTPA